MALLGAINTASSAIGEGLTLADSLYQNQITIQDTQKVDDQVLLNVVLDHELDFVVNISEKPVADLGGAVDYISRTTTPLTLNCVISNRNIDLRQDPFEYVTEHGGSFVPDLINVINQTNSIAGKFFDLGQDEIDKKLAALIKWQNDAVQVEVFGLRLDAVSLTSDKDFAFFIERVTPTVSAETGDNVGLSLTLKNLLHISKVSGGSRRGAVLSEQTPGAVSEDQEFFGASA